MPQHLVLHARAPWSRTPRAHRARAAGRRSRRPSSRCEGAGRGTRCRSPSRSTSSLPWSCPCFCADDPAGSDWWLQAGPPCLRRSVRVLSRGTVSSAPAPCCDQSATGPRQRRDRGSAEGDDEAGTTATPQHPRRRRITMTTTELTENPVGIPASGVPPTWPSGAPQPALLRLGAVLGGIGVL